MASPGSTQVAMDLMGLAKISLFSQRGEGGPKRRMMGEAMDFRVCRPPLVIASHALALLPAGEKREQAGASGQPRKSTGESR